MLSDFLCALILKLNEHMTVMVNDILHHDDFQRTESLWCSVHALVFSGASKLLLLDVSQEEMLIDMQQASTVMKTILYQKINLDYYAYAGADPINILLFHECISVSNSWLNFLKSFIQIAKLSCCVAVFNLSTASDCEIISRVLRSRSQQYYLCLSYAEIVQRSPCNRSKVTVPPFFFRERLISNADCLWQQGAYQLLLNLIFSFKQCGSFSKLKAPLKTVHYSSNMIFSRYPLDRHYKNLFQISESSGRTELVYSKVLLGENIGVVLDCLRFAHYIKMIFRETIGRFHHMEAVLDHLQAWLFLYCDANGQDNHQRLLKSATVEIIKHDLESVDLLLVLHAKGNHCSTVDISIEVVNAK